MITRAKGVHPNRDALDGIGTGFTAGKRPLRLVVYDKLAEQLPKQDKLYFQALIDRRWRGKSPKAASRIEFQVSREWFVNNGISSVNTLFEKQGTVIANLVQDWFRLTTEPVDRTNQNQSRAKTSRLWLSIGEAFDWVFGHHRSDLQPIMRERVKPIRLAQQARGCLANYLRQTGKRPQSIREFSEMGVQAILATFLSDREAEEFLANFQRQLTEWAA